VVEFFLVFYLQKYGNIDVVVSNAAANPSVDSILQTQDSVQYSNALIDVVVSNADSYYVNMMCVGPGC
jgi:dehydrogenase/reductase SDR family protein 4